MTDGKINVVLPDAVLMEQGKAHIETLLAVVKALVADKDYDCVLRNILSEIEEWLEEA